MLSKTYSEQVTALTEQNRKRVAEFQLQFKKTISSVKQKHEKAIVEKYDIISLKERDIEGLKREKSALVHFIVTFLEQVKV